MRRDIGIGLVLVLAVAGVYAPVARYNFVNYDDPDYVSDNSHVRQGLTPDNVGWAFTTLAEANWHPLTWLSHMLDYQVFGAWAGGHHLVNVALHAANSLLLFLVLKRMTGARWPSAAVAALFALHPLHVESVAWVAERKDVLSTLFWILTLGAYVRYAARPGWGRYAAVFLLLALGLMAKPMLVTLPLVFLLLDYWPLGRLEGRGPAPALGPADRPAARARPWALVLEKVPLLALSAASSVTTYVAQQSGGAMAFGGEVAFSQRLTNALVAYLGYLGQMVWPLRLAIFYPYVQDRPLWQPLVAAALLAAVTGLVLWQARRRPYLAVGWLWYLGTLVPVIGLVQVGKQAMADRYTYVPLIGLFLAIAWGVADATRGWRRRRLVLAPASLVLLAALAGLAHAQVGYWADGKSLFGHAVEATSGNAMARCNLALELLDEGRYTEAEALFAEAMRIDPLEAGAYSGLGYIRRQQGRVDEAIQYHRQALRMRPRDPALHNNLAFILEGEGRAEEALHEYREALRLAPDMAEAHDNLGRFLMSLGQTDEAIREYREVVRLRPGDPGPNRNLGLALLDCGRPDEAVGPFTVVARACPDDPRAHNNLGYALAVSGRRKEGIDHLREAVRLDPNLGDAHGNLGWVLAAEGNAAEAAVHFEEAARLRGPGRPAPNQAPGGAPSDGRRPTLGGQGP